MNYFPYVNIKMGSKSVPRDVEHESVNLTQDAAYGDWCIATVAKVLGTYPLFPGKRERVKIPPLVKSAKILGKALW